MSKSDISCCFILFSPRYFFRKNIQIKTEKQKWHMATVMLELEFLFHFAL